MRTKVYKTIKGLASQTAQLTAQEIINNKFCHKTLHWINFKLTEEAMEQFYQDITNIIGGKKRTEIVWKLKRHPHHWALDRMTYTKRNKWSYCAGQDYVSELNALRKYLYNL